MRPYILRNAVIFAHFYFDESGLCRFLEKLLSVYGQFLRFLAKKSGLLPVFKNQKWAEKIGCIF